MGTPLRTRRLRARGFNARHIATLGGRYFMGLGKRASRTAGGLHVYSRVPGSAGNSVTLDVVVSGSAAPVVSVAGTAITATVATTATRAQLVDAINRSPAAQRLVWAQLAPGVAGGTTAVAVASGALAGG